MKTSYNLIKWAAYFALYLYPFLKNIVHIYASCILNNLYYIISVDYYY